MNSTTENQNFSDYWRLYRHILETSKKESISTDTDDGNNIVIGKSRLSRNKRSQKNSRYSSRGVASTERFSRTIKDFREETFSLKK